MKLCFCEETFPGSSNYKYFGWKKIQDEKQKKCDDDTYRNFFFTTYILNLIAWQNAEKKSSMD